MENIAGFRVSVGCARWSEVRGLLRQLQAREPSLTWTEGSGWFDRVFVVTGPSSTVRLAHGLLGGDGG